MYLVYLSYISCIVCWKGHELILVHFFANQLLSVAASFAKRIIIGGLITPIVRLVGIEPNLDNRVLGYERLTLTAFEQMKFCIVDGGRTCQIYPGNRLMPLPNVDHTTLLNLDNLSFIPGDEELVHPGPPPPLRPQPQLDASSSFHPF